MHELYAEIFEELKKNLPQRLEIRLHGVFIDVYYMPYKNYPEYSEYMGYLLFSTKCADVTIGICKRHSKTEEGHIKLHDPNMIEKLKTLLAEVCYDK